MSNTAIVLAGGNGSRMKSDIPKQYINIEDKPIIYYSLMAMEASAYIDRIILVTRVEDLDYCKEEIVDKYRFTKVTDIVAGGSERYLSVYNGLVYAKNSDYVWIHDGARPCVDEDMLARLSVTVQEFGTAVAGVLSKDTIKIVNSNGIVESTPDRSRLWQVQTPQVFKTSELVQAYDRLMSAHNIGNITDDAMVMEHFGDLPVHMAEGNYCNIKVTTPEDIFLVKNFFEKIKK